MGMTTNSVVVTVEGVERIKVTMEGMERWRRSSVHRGGRGAGPCLVEKHERVII
jgi:hypothetical protein